MITLMLRLLRLLPFLVGGHCQLALQHLALRQQLEVYKRTMARPPLRRTDRLFWVVLARVWTGWRRPLVIVTRTPSCGGSDVASASTGPSSPPGPPAVARPSAPRSKPWSAEWSRRIHSYTRSVLSRRSGGETSCPGNKEQKEEGQA